MSQIIQPPGSVAFDPRRHRVRAVHIGTEALINLVGRALDAPDDLRCERVMLRADGRDILLVFSSMEFDKVIIGKRGLPNWEPQYVVSDEPPGKKVTVGEVNEG